MSEENSAKILEDAVPQSHPQPERPRLRKKGKGPRKVIGRNIRIVRALAGHTLPVTCVAFSPDGMLIASVASVGWISKDDTVRIWGADDGKRIHTLKSKGRATAVCFSPDGSLVASGGYDI
jgi:WD40 repeat protein